MGSIEAEDPRERLPQASHRFEMQAAQYEFPYHWLPSEQGNAWFLGRILVWGHEYLGVLKTFRDLVVGLNPRRVLDFGCGDGRLAYELVRAGVPEVVGIDLVEQALAFARAFNLPYGDRARFVRTRVEDLPEGEFDVVVVMEVLEHIPAGELRPTIRAIWERLINGGKVVVSVPTINIPLNPKHERHYTLESLAAHLAPLFRIETVRYIHRLGLMEHLVRKASINRIGALLEPRLTRWLTRWYERWVLPADAGNATHIVALGVRQDRPRTG